MPRKRKARVNATPPSPKVPDGDEGRKLSLDNKKEKLQLLLNDFNAEGNSCLLLLRVHRKHSYRPELANLVMGNQFWKKVAC